MRQGDGNLNCLSSVSWFSDCFQLVCESQCALMRSIEFVVHGRFNLEPFSLVFANLLGIKKPHTEIYTIPNDAHEREHVPKRDLLPVRFTMPFLHWSEDFSVAPKKYISARHKANHKMLFSTASKYFGFSLFNFVLPPFLSRISFEKWYFDFRNNGNYVWHNL